MSETDVEYRGLSATYDPADNKLRLYCVSRLSQATYERVKAAGFRWAGAQKLWVAPAWTPGREDLLTELCGEIGDEDTSLVDRAEERADRFQDYSHNRQREADQAHAAVERICDGIPLGQPILVGHHSERHARKDQERIHNGMRKAIDCWKTSEYWKDRAQGALGHARYKELPAVRARRIKTIEADKRKMERSRDEGQRFIEAWSKPQTQISAKGIANFDHVSACFTLEKYPRELPASQYEGSMSLHSASTGSSHRTRLRRSPSGSTSERSPTVLAGSSTTTTGCSTSGPCSTRRAVSRPRTSRCRSAGRS